MNRDLRPFPSIRSVFEEGWAVYRTRWWSLTLVTLIVYVPIETALSFVPKNGDGFWESGPTVEVQGILEFWIGVIASLAVIHIVHAAGSESRISIGEAFSHAFSRYGSALWATFLFNAAMVVGLVLVIVPGIAVAVYFGFYLQFLLIRGESGSDALAASYRLVKDRWWRFFGVVVVLYAVSMGGAILAVVPLTLLRESKVQKVLSAIPFQLASMFVVVCMTQLFLRLTRPGEDIQGVGEGWIPPLPPPLPPPPPPEPPV